MYNIEEYNNIIKKQLSDYRYHHSICVSKCAKELAKRYGADEEKAEVAGILHDVCKEMSDDDQLLIIKKAGFDITDFEKENKKFYHQLSGAAYAKVYLGIDDEEILSAIRYHTTGRRDMTLLDEIVYLADFISEDRDYDDIDKIRRESERGKEFGMLYATRYTIVSVINKCNPLHPDTVDAYNWILETYFKE